MTEKTSSSIVVPAAAPVIMSVIADFAAYPAWAGVSSAEVRTTGPGGRAETVAMGLDAGVGADRFVLRYAWDGDASVRWEMAEPGSVITQMSGCYRLAAVPGGTQVTFELAAGVRLPLPGLLRRRIEKTVIDTALKGLAVRVAGR